MTALVLWLCSEGDPSTTVGDSVADPLDGSFVNSPTWGSNAAGNSVIVSPGGATRVNSAAIDGTKVDTTLNGAQQATIEYNCEFNATNGQSPNFGIDNNSSSRELYLRIVDDSLRCYINGSLDALATISGSGDGVFTAVIDTTQATQTNRVKFFQNGTQLTTVGGPAQNTTFNLTSTTCFLTFHNDNGGSTDVYFACLHSDAIDSTEVSDRAAAIAADNDTDPDGGAPAVSDLVIAAAHRNLRRNAIYRM